MIGSWPKAVLTEQGLADRLGKHPSFVAKQEGSKGRFAQELGRV